MSKLNSYDCGIHRGPGAVARFSSACIVTPGSANDFEALSSMYGQINELSTSSQIKEVIRSHSEKLQIFAAVVVDGDSATAFRRGAMDIEVGGTQLDFQPGAEEQTIHPFVDGSRIEIFATEATTRGPVAPYNLTTGIVPGAGISMTPAEFDKYPNAASTDTETTPDQEVSDVGAILQSDIDPQDETDNGDVVMEPDESDDSTDESLDQASQDDSEAIDEAFHNIVLAEMPSTELPPLAEITAKNNPIDSTGFIIFDDGMTYGLNRSYTIGRNPETGEGFEPLKISTGNETISRNHATISVDGPRVSITDLGSTNGTFIWNAVNQAWNQLEPNSSVDIEPGTTVALGRRAFVFEGVQSDPRSYEEPHEMPIKD